MERGGGTVSGYEQREGLGATRDVRDARAARPPVPEDPSIPFGVRSKKISDAELARGIAGIEGG
jgi:hypothetical protein